MTTTSSIQSTSLSTVSPNTTLNRAAQLKSNKFNDMPVELWDRNTSTRASTMAYAQMPTTKLEERVCQCI